MAIQNVGLEITSFGVTPLVFQKKVQKLFISAEKASIAIGEKTRDQMRHIIKTNIRRKAGSTGNLEKSIDTVVEDGGRVVGVGFIPTMDQVAPYWYLVNYGGLNAAAKQGRTLFGNFEGGLPDSSKAGTGVGTQSFFETDPKYPMTPVNPVIAMNYISKTINWVATIWRVHYIKRLNKVKVSTFSRGITLG